MATANSIKLVGVAPSTFARSRASFPVQKNKLFNRTNQMHGKVPTDGVGLLSDAAFTSTILLSLPPTSSYSCRVSSSATTPQRASAVALASSTTSLLARSGILPCYFAASSTPFLEQRVTREGLNTGSLVCIKLGRSFVAPASVTPSAFNS